MPIFQKAGWDLIMPFVPEEVQDGLNALSTVVFGVWFLALTVTSQFCILISLLYSHHTNWSNLPNLNKLPKLELFSQCFPTSFHLSIHENRNIHIAHHIKTPTDNGPGLPQAQAAKVLKTRPQVHLSPFIDHSLRSFPVAKCAGVKELIILKSCPK